MSADDVQQSPDEWKYAPVLVSSNRERLNICRMKAIMFAKENKTYVFKWKCKILQEENRPPDSIMQHILEKHAFFWQYFVTGAPCNLSVNINGDVGLVNGSPATLHSLTFSDPDEHSRIVQHIDLDMSLPFGSEIEISQPLAVNVQITPTLDGKPISQRRQKQLEQLRLVGIQEPHEDIIVLPLGQQKSLTKDDFNKYTYKVPTRTRMLSLASVSVHHIFPFDLAFAMTVHKAQGRTIARVVLDLTSHPSKYNQIQYAALFVAMSRVKQADHIRLLVHGDMDYLTSLRPEKNVMAFYHGYETSNVMGMTWAPSTALQYLRQSDLPS